MRNTHIIISIGILACVGCTNPDRTNYSGVSEGFDTLYASDEILAIGKLEQGMFDGDIDIFQNGDLLLHQEWNKGQLISNDYYDGGLKRRLVYVREQIDTMTTRTYYIDMADSSFSIIPYDSEIMGLYKKYKQLSVTSFPASEPTEFIFQNIPDELVSVGVSGADIRFDNNVYVIHPKRSAGDSLHIHFFYKDPSCPSDHLSFEIQ